MKWLLLATALAVVVKLSVAVLVLQAICRGDRRETRLIPRRSPSSARSHSSA